VIAGDERGIADQIGFYIVEPLHVQPDIPQAREEAGLGPSSHRAPARQCPVRGHGLRRVFYSACYPQAALRTQRMIGRAVGAAAAPDVPPVPFDDFIEQAHAAVVRNVLLDPDSV